MQPHYLVLVLEYLDGIKAPDGLGWGTDGRVGAGLRRIVRAAIRRACTAFCGWCVWRPAIGSFRPAGGACFGRPK